jgi:hypothetical protein
MCKGKTVCTLLTEHHAVKVYWGSGIIAPLHSLISALDRSEWSASRLGCFTPRETAPDTHWIGSWVGPRADLDAMVKRKNSLLLQGLETPITQLVVERYNTEQARLFLKYVSY